MGDLTKNISRHEVACKCDGRFGPCNAQTMDWETIQVVQEACDHFAKKLGLNKVTLIINSGCRCQPYNDKPKSEGGVGATKGSYHKLFCALDHKITQITPKELYEYYIEKYPGKYGIALYSKSGFVHLDSRPYKARW
ncbi:K1E myramoyl peptidase [Vibrio phage SHOU24]|uniref:endolysin n=1 Tax=Vibrio phage SHOU24 TaxID=1414739 RepID=UPI0003ED1E9E|nr:endolysin [Vibrio phage SHOU24]AHI61226.1 K1E myramoyl peptidase [Vibrio phage SHOU24]